MPRGFDSHADGISIDTRALSQLARDMKDADRELRRSLQRRMRAALEPAKQAVRAETAWSSRIPAAVTGRVSYAVKGATARVVVDAKKAPEARPLNNAGKSGTFRHPVYGNRDVWVAQAARPFIPAALERSAPAVAREIAKIYDDIARKAGFR